MALTAKIRRLIKLSIATVFLLASSWWVNGVLAHSYKLDEISVGHIWAPPPIASDEIVPVFGAIVNRGSEPLRLIGATTPIADTVSFRTESGSEGRETDSIALLPGKVHAMATWREHMVLAGLRRELRAEDTFEVILEFDDGRTLAVQVIVEPQSGHN
ncbi:MAG: copper chaperone PCu(A)C [Rhodospirillales bacterium]